MLDETMYRRYQTASHARQQLTLTSLATTKATLYIHYNNFTTKHIHTCNPLLQISPAYAPRPFFSQKVRDATQQQKATATTEKTLKSCKRQPQLSARNGG